MAQLNIDEGSAYGYRSSYTQRENYPLEGAASVGHVGTVKLLLEQREVLGIPDEKIDHVIKVATSNSHWFVVQLFFDDVAKWQFIKFHIESILEVGRQKQQSQIVDFAFAQTFKYCSANEIVELKQKLVTAVDKYQHDSRVCQETLIFDFA